MANYTKINLDLQSDLVLSNAKIDAVTGGLRSELDGILTSASAEETRALAAEGVLASDIAAEVTNRVADVNAEETRALAAEGTLTSAIATEKTRAEGKESILSGEILAEKTRAMGIEGGLRTDVNSANSKVDAILASSAMSADTFVEIVALINSVDVTNDQAFAGYVTSNNAALASETANRITDVNAEETRALAAELILRNDLASEKSDRIAKDNLLSVGLDGEVSRATAAEAATLASAKTYAEAQDVIILQAANDYAAGLNVNYDGVGSADAAQTAAQSYADGIVADEKVRAKGIEDGLQTAIDNLVIDSQGYTDNAVSGLRSDVDTAMEAMGAIDFSTIFAQKIGATTVDNQKYSLDKAVMGESLQVFENGLLLEEGADYSVNYGGGVNDAVDVIFGYQIKPDWKVKFFGVPFVASVSDLA